MHPLAIRCERFSAQASSRAIAPTELRELVLSLDPDRILPAREWLCRFEAGTLEVDAVCLTFDAIHPSQFELALPVLREFALTAFWFVDAAALPGAATTLGHSFNIQRCLAELHAGDHVIGIYPRHAPEPLASLPIRVQLKTCRDNCAYLLELLGERPVCVTHPDNAYSGDTLEVLRQMGIKLGFRRDAVQTEYSELEFPRVEALHIIRALRVAH